MNTILILFFVILLTPFFGLPSVYDTWIIGISVALIFLCTYRLYTKKETLGKSEEQMNQKGTKEKVAPTVKKEEQEQEEKKEIKQQIEISSDEKDSIAKAVKKTSKK